MARLRYRAVTRDGVRDTGIVEAPSEQAATESLRSRGLIVLDVRADEGTVSLFQPRIARGDIAELTRALAALLPAGLPLVRAVEVSRGIVRAALHAALADIQERIERGSSFAEALAAHPQLFPTAYVGLVRAGERAGALPDAMARLADSQEEEAQFRSRLLTAAIYPTLLALVGGAAIIVLLVVVLPRFATLFASSGSSLPASTATVLALSAFLREHAGVFGSLALGCVALTVWLITSSGAARARTSLLLALPGTSSFYREVLAARAARSIAMLLTGGAPLISALADAANALESPQARDELLRIRARVREGARVTDALGEGLFFPDMLTRLVAVGEESSQLALFFERAAELFEGRAKRTAARFVALAEPALIIVFGLIVGTIALVLVQAIYGINAGSLRPVR